MRTAALSLFAFLAVPFGTANAMVTDYHTISWDAPGGLAASLSYAHDKVTVWGTRVTTTAWGQGGVDYQAGCTSKQRLPGNSNLTLDCIGTHNGNSYGAGSGYKALVQFWNDANNFIALGIIHDPGPSPGGITVMVEGAAAGSPVGGYWGGGMPVLTGNAHSFQVQWTDTSISWTIDGLEAYRMSYSIAMDNPSFSILGAARLAGDTIAVDFSNIYLSNAAQDPIAVPGESPRATVSSTVNFSGSGVGFAAYLNLHDAYNNAVAGGAQFDVNDVQANTTPLVHINVVNCGTFNHRYGQTFFNTGQNHTWELRYYEGAGKAIFFYDGNPVLEVNITMYGRIFFQIEVNAAQNGDTVNATYDNTNIGGQWGDATPVSPNGTWNTSSFDFWGLDASQTNGAVTTNADFSAGGTVSGLPAGTDWDTIESYNGGQYAGQPVAAIGMIAEWWYGQ